MELQAEGLTCNRRRGVFRNVSFKVPAGEALTLPGAMAPANHPSFE
jgi:hypothetical protein